MTGGSLNQGNNKNINLEFTLYIINGEFLK